MPSEVWGWQVYDGFYFLREEKGKPISEEERKLRRMDASEWKDNRRIKEGREGGKKELEGLWRVHVRWGITIL